VTGTILCAVPPACFSKTASDDLALELLRSYGSALRTLERRLKKRVSADEEAGRYARLCRQVEEVTLSRAEPAAREADFAMALQQGQMPSVRIGAGYVDFLARAQAAGAILGPRHEARLGAAIYWPDELARHLDWFRRATQNSDWKCDPDIGHRIWFIADRLLPRKCGLVEVVDAFGCPGSESPSLRRLMDARSTWDRVMTWLAEWRGVKQAPLPQRQPYRMSTWTPVVASDWERYGVSARGDFMQSRLQSQIEEALNGGPAVDLGNQRHAMLTDELAKHIHKAALKPASIAMIYESGQPTRPFPLRCIDRLPDGWAPTRELHVGLVSMRHLPIDQYIDINWYRNVDVPSHLGLAGADGACFEISVAQFSRLAEVFAGHRLRLFVYHSGFLPAVVAFYRAFATRLASREHKPASMQVIPMLQPRMGGDYVTGRSWPG
jgi:hypothetical protein